MADDMLTIHETQTEILLWLISRGHQVDDAEIDRMRRKKSLDKRRELE